MLIEQVSIQNLSPFHHVLNVFQSAFLYKNNCKNCFALHKIVKNLLQLQLKTLFYLIRIAQNQIKSALDESVTALSEYDMSTFSRLSLDVQWDFNFLKVF
jgi:hypothetical protein